MSNIALILLLISTALGESSLDSQETAPVDTQVNTTEHKVFNASMEDFLVAAISNYTFKVTCLVETPPDDYVPMVQIVNSTQLLALMNVQGNVTSFQNPATCLLVFFYSPSCPFSCKAAPHYNALGRVHKNFKIAAVDTNTRYNFNAQYGIVGVPTLLLFHNGRPSARFNTSIDYSVEKLIRFILGQTGLYPTQLSTFFVTSADFIGPISSTPVQQTDYCLILSWVFITLCAIYFFYYSSWCQILVDSVRIAWREAEAQNHHTD